MDVLIICAIAFVISATLSKRYWNAGEYGRKLSWMMISEAYGLLVIFVFAHAAYYGWMHDLHGVLQDFLRISACSFAAISTLRVHYHHHKRLKLENK